MDEVKKHSGAFTNFITTLLAIIFFTIGANIIVQSWPVDTLEIKSSKILTPVVIAGQDVRWENFYCKQTEVASTTYRQLRDQNNTIWLTTTSYGVRGPGCSTAIVSMTVPVNAKSGNYVVDSAITFEINRIRSVTVNYTTPSFQVVQPVIVTKPIVIPHPVDSVSPLDQPSPLPVTSVLQPVVK